MNIKFLLCKKSLSILKEQSAKLVDRPSDHSLVGTIEFLEISWINWGAITKNKARLVTQGFNQEEKID